MHHIRNSLPEIKAKIQSALTKYQQELLQLGDPLNDGSSSGQANLVLNIITEFCTEFRTIIDGTSNDLTSFELSGGARISFVFHELYSNGVKTIDPLDQIKDVDIRTILYNSSVKIWLKQCFVYIEFSDIGLISCSLCSYNCFWSNH